MSELKSVKKDAIYQVAMFHLAYILDGVLFEQI